MEVYQAIARKVEAMRNCYASGNEEWFGRHDTALFSIIREYMPNGSGFDGGTEFDIAAHIDSAKDELRFTVSFHHMNDCGTYDGWTQHSVIIRPNLSHGFTLRVTGRDRNGIKDYIADTFHHALKMAYVESDV